MYCYDVQWFSATFNNDDDDDDDEFDLIANFAI